MLGGSKQGSIATVIVNYRTPHLALEALAAVARERKNVRALEAVIVDGGSGDGSAEILARAIETAEFAGWVTLLAPAINGGFGWANNQAVLRLLQRDDPPDYVHFLNPDTLVSEGAIRRLGQRLDSDPRIGAVGSLLLNSDDTIAGSAFRFPSIGREFVRGIRTPKLGPILGIEPLMIESEQACAVDWVTGASVMVRTTALKDCGLFDHGFFLYFEEVELMWRLRRSGWTIWHEPASRVTHIGGVATGMQNTKDARVIPTPPDYWFASRRRFLTRTRGGTGAVAASAAWLAGHALWKLRCGLGLARGAGRVRKEARTLFRNRIVPKVQDHKPAIGLWTDPPGSPPQWMDTLG